MILTYADLKNAPPNAYIGCRRGGCDEFGSRYSATRGDYFMTADDEEITCGACGKPMLLLAETCEENVLAGGPK